MKKQKVDEVDSALDAKIEKQNKDFYKLRDKLEKYTKKPVHISILEANRQAIPGGNSEVSSKHTILTFYFVKMITLSLELNRCWTMSPMLSFSER